MALKTVVDDIATVAEGLRSEYEKRDDGKWHLKLDGAPADYVPRAQFVEFRGNNARLMQALGAATVDEALATVSRLAEFRAMSPEQLAALKAIDPAEHARLKAQLEKLTAAGAKDPDSLKTLIASALEPALSKLKDIEAKATAQEAALAQAKMREVLGGAALKAGARQDALAFVLQQAAETFEVKDGSVAARVGKIDADGNGITPEAWVAAQARAYPFAFAASTGSGAAPAGGNGGAHGGGGSQARIISPGARLSQQDVADIASGKAVRAEAVAGA